MATRPKRPRDPNQLAKLIVELSIGEEKDPEESKKAQVGRLGGLKGGVARSIALTPDQRKKIAKKAAKARWRKRETVD